MWIWEDQGRKHQVPRMANVTKLFSHIPSSSPDHREHQCSASGIWLNSRERKVWFLSHTWNPLRERRQMYLQLGLEQARKEARGVVVNIPIDFYQYLLNNEHEYLRDNHSYKFGDFFWKLPTFFRKSVFMIVPIWVSGKLLLLVYFQQEKHSMEEPKVSRKVTRPPVGLPKDETLEPLENLPVLRRSSRVPSLKVWQGWPNSSSTSFSLTEEGAKPSSWNFSQQVSYVDMDGSIGEEREPKRRRTGTITREEWEVGQQVW